MRQSARSIVAAILSVALLIGCAVPPRSAPAVSQILFVCEHGNVKSLMAASYFNQLAQARGLPWRGISRASAPDSTAVPPRIVAGLSADGFDVRTFRPVALSAADVSASRVVVTIGTPLPGELARGAIVEQWNDVPAASIDYAAARSSLKKHVQVLLDQLVAER